MTTEQKSKIDPPEEHSPQNKSTESGKWSDILGFGRMMDKLPLHKLSARMAYCMFFDLLLLLFVIILRLSGTQVNEFPNAWDFRFIVLTTIIVFLIGLCDLVKFRKK